MTPLEIRKALDDARAEAEKHGFERDYFDALFNRNLAVGQKDALIKLRALAATALHFEVLMERLEAFTKQVAAAYEELTVTILPSLMDELDVPSLALSATQTLGIKTTIRANIPAARLEEGCEWLVANGHGSIIKQDVIVTFGTEQGEKAAKVVEAIKAAGEVPNVKKSVNHQTLSALVRGELEEGADLPMDLLGVYRRRAAVVSTKKT